MAAFIPLIPMVADAIAALINGVKNANDKNENNNDQLAQELKYLREKLDQKEGERIAQENQAKDDMIAQAQRLNEDLAKREKEQHERNEALVNHNRNLLEKMQDNEEEQRKRNAEIAAQNDRLQQQIQEYQKQHETQMKEMAKLLDELKKKGLNTFEDIENQNKAAKEALVRLALKARPIGMEGINVGLFGITSTGKSTMLNALYGKKVAETGIGETTVKVTSYQTEHFTLWDVPGKNDEISYLSMQYISFFKGLTKRVILIGNTVKENSSMMKLLDAIGLSYDIVVNKMDQYEEDDIPSFCTKIKDEVGALKLAHVNHIFFVSARFPKQFPDWIKMVDYLTGDQTTKN